MCKEAKLVDNKYIIAYLLREKMYKTKILLCIRNHIKLSVWGKFSVFEVKPDDS